jgi:hypothetical protein
MSVSLTSHSSPPHRQHILLHYNASMNAFASLASSPPPTRGSLGSRVLADHTFFLQPHLAWDWIARPRINLVGPDTGFAHFGPMLRNVRQFASFFLEGRRRMLN